MMDALLIDLKAFQKLWYYVNCVKTEICGIGKIERDNLDFNHVTDIIILPQEVGSVDANVTPEDMQAFFETIPDAEKTKWCFHWHTHPTFSPTPSGTDLNNWARLIQDFYHFVPCIFSQDGRWTGRVHNDFPVRGHYEIENIWIYEFRKKWDKLGKRLKKEDQIPFLINALEMHNLTMTQEEIDWCAFEVEAKVKKKAYVAPVYSSYQGYQHQNNQRQIWTPTVPTVARFEQPKRLDEAPKLVEASNPLGKSLLSWTNVKTIVASVAPSVDLDIYKELTWDEAVAAQEKARYEKNTELENAMECLIKYLENKEEAANQGQDFFTQTTGQGIATGTSLTTTGTGENGHNFTKYFDQKLVPREDNPHHWTREKIIAEALDCDYKLNTITGLFEHTEFDDKYDMNGMKARLWEILIENEIEEDDQQQPPMLIDDDIAKALEGLVPVSTEVLTPASSDVPPVDFTDDSKDIKIGGA